MFPVLRVLCIALVLKCVTLPSPAQGIRGVTRRTTTLEMQAPARQFFDAAGIPVNGTTAGVAPGQSPPAAMVRPEVRPLLATRPSAGPAGIVAPAAGVARPYVLGTAPRPVVAARPVALPAARPATISASTNRAVLRTPSVQRHAPSNP